MGPKNQRRAEDYLEYGPLRLQFGASAAAGHWEQELCSITARLVQLGAELE